MNEDEIGAHVVDAAINIHRKLGPGLLESVYEVVLAKELDKRGLKVERQVPIAIKYDGLLFKEGFRADIIVQRMVIIELKCVRKLTNAYKKQLLTYLRLSNMRLGYLLNFSEALMKHGIIRIVNNLGE